MKKTSLELKREERYKFDKDRYVFVVQNIQKDGVNATLETIFEDIENVLHKIKLDLMTMAHHEQADESRFFIKIFLRKK